MTDNISESYHVVFTGNWCQTVPLGTMIDHKASDEPVRLPKLVADRAIADGKAKRFEQSFGDGSVDDESVGADAG